MSNERFESVWDAIEDTPEAAQNMKLLSLLLIGHKHPRTRLEIGQAHADKLFGVSQPGGGEAIPLTTKK